MFMCLRVEEDHRPSSVVGNQSTIVITIIYTTHFACYLHFGRNLVMSCAYHMVQCIYYYRSQPKQALLEAVELVDMEKKLELEKELEVDLELVVCRTFYHWDF